MEKLERIKSWIIVVSILLVFFLSFRVESQVRKPSTKPKTVSAQTKKPIVVNKTETPQIFKTDSLSDKDLFKYIYDGRFNRVKYDLTFKLTFAEYVETFSRQCQKFLPDDKLEITQYVEVYRERIGNQTKKHLQERGTGIYATPQMGAVYVRYSSQQLEDVMKQARTSSGMPGAVNFIIFVSQRISSDVDTYFRQNGCASPMAKMFSENLLRFAEDRPSFQDESTGKTYFERVCETKLLEFFPASNPGSCRCIKSKLASKDIQFLEDYFDLDSFLLASVSSTGTNEEVSLCMN